MILWHKKVSYLMKQRTDFDTYPHDELDLTSYPEQQLSEVCQLERGGWVLDAQAQQERRRHLRFISTGVQQIQNLLQDLLLLLQLIAYQSLCAFQVPPTRR